MGIGIGIGIGMIGQKTRVRAVRFVACPSYLMIAAASIATLSGPVYPQAKPTATFDTLAFGNATSESVHQTSSELSQTITGGLNQPARTLLLRDPQSWDGGSVSF